MLLQIITEPNPILHKIGNLVPMEQIKTEEFQQLIQDMAETMHLKDGVGLAAPQVGESLQLCVITKGYSHTKEDLILINPMWEKMSIRKAWDTEGCLSVPQMYGEVKRYKQIKVKALDKDGNQIEFQAKDFLARIIQHEVDHINGHLFIEKAKNVHRVEEKTL